MGEHTLEPYEVMTARVALVEAANLNREALDMLGTVDPKNAAASAGENEAMRTGALLAQSLSIYALALNRWMTTP